MWKGPVANDICFLKVERPKFRVVMLLESTTWGQINERSDKKRKIVLESPYLLLLEKKYFFLTVIGLQMGTWKYGRKWTKSIYLGIDLSCTNWNLKSPWCLWFFGPCRIFLFNLCCLTPFLWLASLFNFSLHRRCPEWRRTETCITYYWFTIFTSI